MSGGDLVRRLIFLVALCAAGCAAPIARQHCAAPPVEAKAKVRAVAKEVHRGALGGVVVVEVTNLSDEPLAEVNGGEAVLLVEGGAKSRSLRQAEFQQLVDLSGPIAMGFEDWSTIDLPAQLDPLGSVVNLQKNESALVSIGFGESVRGKSLTIDLGPTLIWRDATGRTSKLDRPLPLQTPLPEVPSTKLPTRDFWRRIPINFAVSSDGF